MTAATVLPKTLRDYFWVYPRSRYGPLRNPRDFFEVPRFLVCGPGSVQQRWRLLCDFYRVTFKVRCYHAQHEVLEFARFAWSRHALRGGVFVECGAYKGGGTTKFSILAANLGTQLIVYDSFEGLPENEEMHGKSIFGEKIQFPGGRFRASINEVKGNIGSFGALSSCVFRPGWFRDTLPLHSEPIAAAFIDVDLQQSTRECLMYLYPKLIPGGSIFSQDGHIPLVVNLIQDCSFWREIGEPSPILSGLRTRKLIRITKPDV